MSSGKIMWTGSECPLGLPVKVYRNGEPVMHNGRSMVVQKLYNSAYRPDSQNFYLVGETLSRVRGDPHPDVRFSPVTVSRGRAREDRVYHVLLKKGPTVLDSYVAKCEEGFVAAMPQGHNEFFYSTEPFNIPRGAVLVEAFEIQQSLKW